MVNGRDNNIIGDFYVEIELTRSIFSTGYNLPKTKVIKMGFNFPNPDLYW